MDYRKVFGVIFFFYSTGALATYIKLRNESHGNKVAAWTKFLLHVGIICSLLALSLFSKDLLTILFGILCLGGLWEIYSVGTGSVQRRAVCLSIYLGISLFFLIWLAKSTRVEFFSTFMLTAAFDGFCQVTGQLFGKTKLAPTISPGKTVEGFILGGLGTIFLATGYTQMDYRLAAVLCCSALLGDLLASWYKRISSIKDFSNFIPAHGGILDRFDSFFMVGAVLLLLN